ncbi:MAG TPA: hypothetical protein VLA72_12220 [Anaerolineales bacterium]|nr:hypothetical protein [Anaerolineales bacterium]
MKNRTVKLLGLIFALFIVMACSTIGGGAGEENTPIEEPASSVEGGEAPDTNNNEEASTTESGLCVNEYYPVVEGGVWNYQGTSSEAEDYTFSNTITAVRDDGFSIQVEFDNVTLNQEWACTPEGILALDVGGGTAGTLTTSDVNLVMVTQNSSGITYPNEITPGDTWTQTLDYTGTMDFGGETTEVSGDTVYNSTAIGVESVTVPAGTFDAMKIEVIMTINIKMNIGGTEMPVTVTTTTLSWFAKDVGWVKSDSSSNIAGFSTTESIELTSYSIP